MDNVEVIETRQYKIDFEIIEGDLTYRDCLILSEAVYLSMSPEDIEATKRQRFENWKAFVEIASQQSVEESVP